jgi:CRISPR-associated protein Cmr6
MKEKDEKKVFETIKELLERNKCDNLALLFNKLLPFSFKNSNSLKAGNFKKKEVFDNFLENLRIQNQKEIDELFKSLEVELCFTITTAYRLAIGMGYPSLVENGLLFHHTYGIPYIPGETLKGLARGVFLLSVYEAIKEGREFKERLSEEEKKEEKRRRGPMSIIESAFLSEDGDSEAFVKSLENLPVLFEEDIKIEKPYEFYGKVFGTQKKRGEVIFFDAFPVGFNPQNHFKIDIMNPHYSEYYGEKGKKPPADWYNPVPIHFLTVSEGVKFKVCLAHAPLSEEDESLLEKVKVLLKVGLENFGVGGKKRKGYGWFKVEGSA